MRSTLSEVIPEPSVAQLRAYYDENRDLYMSDSARSFEQVFFFAIAERPADPQAFTDEIKRTDDFAALGDYNQYGNTVRKLNFRQMAL